MFSIKNGIECKGIKFVLMREGEKHPALHSFDSAVKIEKFATS